MARPLIAVTDSPFPSLDPAKAALARLDPELRMAKSASADDILAVARDADAMACAHVRRPFALERVELSTQQIPPALEHAGYGRGDIVLELAVRGAYIQKRNGRHYARSSPTIVMNSS